MGLNTSIFETHFAHDETHFEGVETLYFVC